MASKLGKDIEIVLSAGVFPTALIERIVEFMLANGQQNLDLVRKARVELARQSGMDYDAIIAEFGYGEVRMKTFTNDAGVEVRYDGYKRPGMTRPQIEKLIEMYVAKRDEVEKKAKIAAQNSEQVAAALARLSSI